MLNRSKENLRTRVAYSLLLSFFLYVLNIGAAFATPKYSILHTFFSLPAVRNPIGIPTLGPDGDFYGISEFGGVYNQGTLFKVSLSGVITTLYSFEQTTTLGSPNAELSFDSNGNIYGTTVPPGGLNSGSTIWKIKSDGTSFRVLATVSSLITRGVTSAPDGNLYGSTLGDGTGYGTIFKIKENGSETSPTVLHAFKEGEPYAPLKLLVSHNTIYGVADLPEDGGVFALPISGGSDLKIASFNYNNGSYPTSVILAKDGNLYGTTMFGGNPSGVGNIFKYSTLHNTITSLYSIPDESLGYPPTNIVEGPDGSLYGATSEGGIDSNGLQGNGTIFKISLKGQGFRDLYTFPNDNNQPIFTTGITTSGNGSLYGFLARSGVAGTGEFYGFTKSPTGKFHYHEFADFGKMQFHASNPLFGSLIARIDYLSSPLRFQLFGTGGGTYLDTSFTKLFTIQPDGKGYDEFDGCLGLAYRGFSFLPEGGYAVPTFSTAQNPGGLLYISYGQIATTGVFSGPNGANPDSNLVTMPDGDTYGTTEAGGTNNLGCIYRVNSSVAYSFTGGSDGSDPVGGLTRGSDGYLYGCCFQGALNNNGSLWKLSQTGVLTTLHQFLGPDGLNPKSGMIEGFDGKLYGTTRNGGANNDGLVFVMNRDGSDYKVLHNFSGTGDGKYPTGSLTRGSNGLIYGTTRFGATNNGGTIFAISANGGKFEIQHSFVGGEVDGLDPAAGVIEAPDGNLYGTTNSGGVPPAPGVDVEGTIYKLETKLPIINNFFPKSGLAGTTVTITGSNLADLNTIRFGNGIGTIVSHTATQIVATVPTNATSDRIVLTVGKTPCISSDKYEVK